MISYTIFIVDDEPSVREGIVMALGTVYRMEGFSNAEDTLSAMKTEAPDLVLLDVGLPGMDGIAALKEIKRSHTAMPVIMITANEGSRHKAYAEMLGVDDYIRKPFGMDRLLESIKRLLA